MFFLEDFKNFIPSSDTDNEREESLDSSLSIQIANEAAGYSKTNTKPVFILFTIGNSPMAKGIQKLYNTTISHVCISFNINLDPLYSFGCKSMKPFKMGFVTNSPKSPQTWGKDPTPWFLYVTYVSPKAIASMRKRLQFFISNQEKMHYSFPTLAKLFFRAKSPKGMNWVCSTFCSEILKAGGVELTKDSTQYLPQDMIDIKNVDFVIQGKDIQTDYEPKKAFQALARVRKAETVERYTFRDNKMIPIAANEAMDTVEESIGDSLKKWASNVKKQHDYAKEVQFWSDNGARLIAQLNKKYASHLSNLHNIANTQKNKYQNFKGFDINTTNFVFTRNEKEHVDIFSATIFNIEVEYELNRYQYRKNGTDFVKATGEACKKYLSDNNLPGYIQANSILGNNKDHEYADYYTVKWIINANKIIDWNLGKGKLAIEAMESSTNTEGINNKELRAKFKDVLYVVNTLPKEDLYYICNGEFKDSPYVIYRKIAYSNNTPIGFVDVYCRTKELKKGYVVIAVSPQYRRSGVARLLILKLLIDFTNNPEYKQYRLIWRADADNIASINMATNLGFRQFYKSPEKTEFDFPRNRAKKINSEETHNNDFAIENFMPDIENFQQIAIEGKIDIKSSLIYKDDEKRAKEKRILCIVSNLNTSDFMHYVKQMNFIKELADNLIVVPFDLNDLCNICRGYPSNFGIETEIKIESYIKKCSERIINPGKVDSTLKVVAQAIELYAKENKDCFVVLHISSPYQLQYFYKFALARTQFTPRKALKLNRKALLRDLPEFENEFEMTNNTFVGKGEFIPNPQELNLYHVSTANLTKLVPIPTRSAMAGENVVIPRISATDSINKCFNAINTSNGMIYHVYKLKLTPEHRVFRPNEKMVPDASLTGEVWVLKETEIDWIEDRLSIRYISNKTGRKMAMRIPNLHRKISFNGKNYTFTANLLTSNSDPHPCALIKLMDGKIEVSSFSFWPHVSCISQIKTNAKYRRKGFARFLLQSYIDTLGASLATTEFDPDNQAVIGLLKSVGFTELGRTAAGKNKPEKVWYGRVGNSTNKPAMESGGFVKASFGGFERKEWSKYLVDSYKCKDNMLIHAKMDDDIKGAIFFDKENDIVTAYVGVQNGDIIALWVHPDYRHKGYGCKLLNMAHNSYGATSLTVSKSNLPAVNMYKKQGWEVYDDNNKIYFMRMK